MDIDYTKLVQLGNIVGETTHSKIIFTAKRPPRVGEYVLIEYPETEHGKLVLGFVERSLIGNPALQYEVIRPEYVERALSMNIERHEYMMGQARLLGWVKPLIERHELITPKYPPKPGSYVYEAVDEVLMRIFKKRVEDGWVRVGRLINHPNVEVYVNVNMVVNRHLAILAVTGAGKSNTVAILVQRIVNELGGTVLIIDPHNEYGKIADSKTNIVLPTIHPAKLTIYEYYNLLSLDPQASKQRMYLRKAYNELEKTRLQYPDKFLDELIKKLNEYASTYKGDSRSITDLINKLEELRERYWNKILSVDAPVNLDTVIKPGYANVIQLGEYDEEASDTVTYHYLDWLLKERKSYIISRGEKGYPLPVLVVIEEAHILIPRDDITLTKNVVARIAREGRKFGVGLCLVSQRPKKLDEDALSQTNNKIILKLVEPNDKRYVQSASETLSEELLEMLSDLNTGEAILLGMMTPLPALVKIDLASNKPTGRDIAVHKEWGEWSKRKASGDNKVYTDELIP